MLSGLLQKGFMFLSSFEQKYLRPPAQSKWIIISAEILLLLLTSVFCLAAYHKISLFFLGEAELAKKIDFVLVVQGKLAEWGIPIARTEAFLLLFIVLALLAFTLLFARRTKALSLLLSALFLILSPTLVFIIAPEVVSEVQCGCIGVLLDTQELLLLALRNAVLTINALWLAWLWMPAKIRANSNKKPRSKE